MKIKLQKGPRETKRGDARGQGGTKERSREEPHRQARAKERQKNLANKQHCYFKERPPREFQVAKEKEDPSNKLSFFILAKPFLF